MRLCEVSVHDAPGTQLERHADGESPGRDAMDTSPQYEIRVRGSLTARVATAFDELVVSPELVLRGTLVDQAALHGALDRIRDLGLELVDVRRVGDA
jgi:hypothetical protein